MEWLVPALAHLEIAKTTPDTVIYCWDEESTGVAMPAPPWGDSAYTMRGEVVGYSGGRHHVVSNAGRFHLSLLDNDQAIGIYWLRSLSRLPYWERACPFRSLFTGWCRGREHQLTHAAAVGVNGSGVLIAGNSGSGKSTTALACLNGGLSYAGDDYVLTTAEPRAYSLYSSGKMVSARIDMFPQWSGIISNPSMLDNEKAIFWMGHHFPQQMVESLSLKAIILPRVTQKKETAVSRATGIDALTALAPSTIAQTDGDRSVTLTNMRMLVEKLPRYWLDVGTDLAQIPVAVRNLLERIHD